MVSWVTKEIAEEITIESNLQTFRINSDPRINSDSTTIIVAYSKEVEGNDVKQE